VASNGRGTTGSGDAMLSEGVDRGGEVEEMEAIGMKEEERKTETYDNPNLACIF